jgi:hypothetical protein
VAGHGKHSEKVLPARFSRVELDGCQSCRSFDLRFLLGECSTNPLLEFRLSVLSTAAPSPIDIHTWWRTHICRSQWRRPIRESTSDASVAIRNGSRWSLNGLIRPSSTRSCATKQSGVVLSLVRQHVALATGALPRPPRAGSCPGSTCTLAASLETSALGKSLRCSESDRPRKSPSRTLVLVSASPNRHSTF